LLDAFAAGKPVKPGPQIDRQLSAPVGGPTALTGEIYRPGPKPWTPPEPPVVDEKKPNPESKA
jgi:NADH-quinone oxidoreductase subunit E